MSHSRKQHIHEFLRPVFPEWAGLRHIYGINHEDHLTRMHLELLHVLASKNHLDLFEVASLLNISHVSAAEIVDCLMDKGLVEEKASSEESFRIGLTNKEKGRFASRPKGFTSIKDVIKKGTSPAWKYGMYSKKAMKNQP